MVIEMQQCRALAASLHEDGRQTLIGLGHGDPGMPVSLQLVRYGAVMDRGLEAAECIAERPSLPGFGGQNVAHWVAGQPVDEQRGSLAPDSLRVDRRDRQAAGEGSGHRGSLPLHRPDLIRAKEAQRVDRAPRLHTPDRGIRATGDRQRACSIVQAECGEDGNRVGGRYLPHARANPASRRTDRVD